MSLNLAPAGLRSSLGGVLAAIVLLLVAHPAPAQQPAIDPALAGGYFAEAQALCTADGGRLWGVSLCGPMLFVDRKTRSVVANQADREGVLTKQGEVFTGTLPQRVNIANTAVEWAGVRWTMMIWSPPANKTRRASLMIHELWHRVQLDLGLLHASPANAHLDSVPGRVWLQLEWRALKTALATKGGARQRAIADALLFRRHRQGLFGQAMDEERALEMNEGLAEYTGIKLSGTGTPVQDAVAEIDDVAKRETFVRSFAYATGPAYGLLLDDTGTKWRAGLKPSADLGDLLGAAANVRPPRDLKRVAEERAKAYDGDALLAAETERDRKRQQVFATYRARLVDGAILVIPLRQMNMSFDPNTPVPLEARGTVYPTIRITDVWGILTVTEGGALMSPTYADVRVAAPTVRSGRAVRGDGWTLELNAGWDIVPGERKGDHTLKQN